MEEQVLQLLQATTTPDTSTIRNAEEGLLRLYPQVDFPFALLTIASHTNIDAGLKKASLTAIKNYVLATWSPQIDEHFRGSVYLNDEAKSRVREQLFNIGTSNQPNSTDTSLQALAAGVVSRIASVDFPDAWPTLFPSLMNILNTSTDDVSVHGALRVLAELIDSGFTEEQFFGIARDLVQALQVVAIGNRQSLVVRAMTLNVFRACFEMLEMVMADHSQAVQAFLDESLKTWMEFFIETLKESLPSTSSSGDNEQWRGIIALKVQVVKVCHVKCCRRQSLIIL